MRYRRFAFLALLATAVPLSAAGPQDSGNKALSLEECVEIAMQHHPDLAAAEALVAQAREQVKIAHSNYLPQINMGSFYTRQTYNYAGQPGTPPFVWHLFYRGQNNSTSPYYYGGVNLNQTIYDFGRKKGVINRSTAALAATEQDYKNVRMQVYYNVRASYYTLLADRELEKVQEESLASEKKHLDQAQAFYKVGRGAKIDVTRQQVAVANAQLALNQARENMEVAHAALATAMGIPIEKAPDIQDVLAQVEPLPNRDQLLNEAIQNRPDLESLRDQIAVARANMQYAHSNLKPNFNFSSFYNFNNLVFPLVNNWSLAGLFAQNLFSGGARHAELRLSEAAHQGAEAQRDSLFLQVRQQVYTAYSDLSLATDQIDTALTADREAKENLELAEGRYRVGYGNIIELTDAQLLAASAAGQVVTSRYQYQSAAAKLDLALGRAPK